MEYICLNCGHITENLICPNCQHTISENEYNKVIEKAQKSIRYGYYYRKKAEKDLDIHYNLLSPTNYLEWIAAAVLAGVSYDLLKYLAIKVYNHVKDKLKSNERYSMILDILNDERKFREFVKYLQEYKDGLVTLDEDKRNILRKSLELTLWVKKPMNYIKRRSEFPTLKIFYLF